VIWTVKWDDSSRVYRVTTGGKMKRWHIAALVAGLFVAVCTFAGEKVESVVKTFRLNPTEIAITCKNGGDPTIVTAASSRNLLIVSCGK
jgi:hypothetical protein